MKLIEFKKLINSIPNDMDEFMIVNGEFGLATDGNTFLMTNNELHTIYVDKNNREIQLLHQTDKDIKNILLDGDS